MKSKLCIACIAIFTIIFLSSHAFAATVTLESYLKEKKETFKEFTEIWIDGVFNGLEAANIELSQKHKAPLFCIPPQLAVTEYQVKAIADAYIAKHKSTLPMNVGTDLVLQQGLEETFPCP